MKLSVKAEWRGGEHPDIGNAQHLYLGQIHAGCIQLVENRWIAHFILADSHDYDSFDTFENPDDARAFVLHKLLEALE